MFVDRLSKRVHLAPVETTITAPQLARVFVDTVVKHHGVPEIIVSDRDPRFVSEFWRSLFSLLGTQLNISTAFHPQTDGQTERTNRQLEQVLRHYVNAQHTDWDELLAVAEFAINSHVSAATGFTPFFLDTGMHPRIPLSLAAQSLGTQERQESAPGTETVPGPPFTTQAFVHEWNEAEKAAKVAMRIAQDRYAAHADYRRLDTSFADGDKVLLSTENLKLPSTVSWKFTARWIGPYPVRRAVSPVAYELLLPRTLRVHPVFHVSLLKAYREDAINPSPPPPEPIVNDEGEQEYFVQELLQHRVRRIGRRSRVEFLVRWTGYGPDADEWIPLADVEETEAYDRYEAEMKRAHGPNWPNNLLEDAPATPVPQRRTPRR